MYPDYDGDGQPDEADENPDMEGPRVTLASLMGEKLRQ